MSTLFVVATPIGNLGDLSPRAEATLREVGTIAAEDTRRTRALLTHFGIGGKELLAVHAHSSAHELERALGVLEAGRDLALVSDAGVPLVSDPGSSLVSAAITAGHTIVPLPGPSAVLTALVGSGLGGGAFRFFGFLPRAGTTRREALTQIAQTPEAVVIFESPERLTETLQELALLTPTRGACVARELTKRYEEFVRGSLQQLAELGTEWRGEIVLVLGAHQPAGSADIDDEQLLARVRTELETGTHAKAIAQTLAAWSGRKMREVYELVVREKNARGSSD
jgi:16S rRNA (cytidine1402-2'-O)-methyltransferase